MTHLDERLHRSVERLASEVDPSGALEAVLARKRRRGTVRRAQLVALTASVLAATVGGSLALARVFLPAKSPRPPASETRVKLPLTGNGKIAFESDRDGNYNIYVMNPDGTGLRKLTDDPAVDTLPTWSPDGRRIAFVSKRTDNWDIYVMNPDGTGVKNLTHGPADDYHPAWSPDGSKIAFVSDRPIGPVPGQQQVYVMNADGSGVRKLSDIPDGAWHPAWSPDGKMIAFDPTPGARAGAIYVVNADGSGERKIFADKKGWDDFLRAASWSPDGRKLAFTRGPSGVIVPQPWSDVYVINVDGTGLTRLTRFKDGGDPSWSPDGARIVFDRSRTDLYVMNADGTEVTELTGGSANDTDPSWQPVASR